MTISLCETCKNMREVHTERSRFLFCELSAANAAYPKYPRQPVAGCAGYETTHKAKLSERDSAANPPP